MRGEGVKMSVFVHTQGIKTVHAGGVKKWQNSVHVCSCCILQEAFFEINKEIIYFTSKYQNFIKFKKPGMQRYFHKIWLRASPLQ